MYIRGRDASGQTTRMFNEKADIRTFYDLYAEKYNDYAFWSRHGNNILLAPGFRNTGTNLRFNWSWSRRMYRTTLL